MTFFLTCCNEDATNQGSNFSEGYDTRQDTLKINLRFSSNITFKFKFIWILFFYTNNLLIFLFLKNLNKHKNFWKFSVLLITDYGKLFCESRCQIYRKFPRKKKKHSKAQNFVSIWKLLKDWLQLEGNSDKQFIYVKYKEYSPLKSPR